MKVKVRYTHIKAETDKALLLRMEHISSEFWIPKKCVGKIYNKSVMIDEWLAKKLELKYKNPLHVPEPIEPQKSEVIEELKWE